MDWKYASEEAYIEQGKLQENRGRPKKEKSIKEKPEPLKVYWEVKDGSKIDIDKMSEAHLRNTLKMIVTNNLLKDK